MCNSDLNNDNYINIIDIVLLVVYILDEFSLNEVNNCFDINSDSEVNILDITSLVNYIFNNQ